MLLPWLSLPYCTPVQSCSVSRRSSSAAPEAAADMQEEDGMHVDEDDEYRPPSSRPTSARGRKRSKDASSSGRPNGRGSSTPSAQALAEATAAAVAAATAASLEGSLPRKIGSLGARSGSGGATGGDGTDAADSGNQLAVLGLTGYEGYEAAYDPSMYGLSGDLDGAFAAMSGGRGLSGNLSRQEKLKEKNRLAQRRFRARQKDQLEQMQARMDELNDQVGWEDVAQAMAGMTVCTELSGCLLQAVCNSTETVTWL